MEQRLTLADGTVISNAYGMLVDGNLFIYIDNTTMDIRDVFALLSNTKKTKRIRSQAFGEDITYQKYTDIYFIRRELDGSINAGLRKAG